MVNIAGCLLIITSDIYTVWRYVGPGLLDYMDIDIWQRSDIALLQCNLLDCQNLFPKIIELAGTKDLPVQAIQAQTLQT